MKVWERYKDTILLSTIVLGLMGLVGLTLFNMYIRNDYYPLKFDERQNVLREPPVFHLGDAVAVEATFLNKDEQNVTFGGVVQWQLVSPNSERLPVGSRVLQFEFTTLVEPGCRELLFENRPPSSVVDITKELFAGGHDRVVWKLVGDNVILSPKSGGTVAFEVEDFAYIPDDVALPKHQDIKDNTNCQDFE